MLVKIFFIEAPERGTGLILVILQESNSLNTIIILVLIDALSNCIANSHHAPVSTSTQALTF